MSDILERVRGELGCQEVIRAGTGLRTFRIVRAVQEVVSGSFETAGEAWADAKAREGDSCSVNRSELDALAYVIAYSAACTMIESECTWHGTDGVGWFDVGIENFGDDDVLDSVKYLEMRGLIERHPENRDWIQVRDESEATA